LLLSSYNRALNQLQLSRDSRHPASTTSPSASRSCRMGMRLPLRASSRSEGDTLVEPLRDFAPLQLHFVDHIQWRYEVIRPLVLWPADAAAPGAEEPHLHRDAVRRLTRRFQQQGMRGLLPAHTELAPPSRGRPVPAVVVAEVARLKALYHGFGYRELARIIH